jgi:hypothetical protein
LPSALSHLCLVCARSFTGTGYACGRFHFLWSRALENEWAAYYERFYSPEEEAQFIREEDFGERSMRLQLTMTTLFTLLKSRGNAPSEVGTREEEEEEEEEEKEEYVEDAEDCHQEEEDHFEEDDGARDSEGETGSVFGEDVGLGDW